MWAVNERVEETPAKLLSTLGGCELYKAVYLKEEYQKLHKVVGG